MIGLNFVAAFLLSAVQGASPERVGDDPAWMQARRLDTPEAYQTYLKERPNGRHAAIAYALLRRSVPLTPESRNIPAGLWLAQSSNCIILGNGVIMCRNQSSESTNRGETSSRIPY